MLLLGLLLVTCPVAAQVAGVGFKVGVNHDATNGSGFPMGFVAGVSGRFSLGVFFVQPEVQLSAKLFLDDLPSDLLHPQTGLPVYPVASFESRHFALEFPLLVGGYLVDKEHFDIPFRIRMYGGPLVSLPLGAADRVVLPDRSTLKLDLTASKWLRGFHVGIGFDFNRWNFDFRVESTLGTTHDVWVDGALATYQRASTGLLQTTFTYFISSDE